MLHDLLSILSPQIEFPDDQAHRGHVLPVRWIPTVLTAANYDSSTPVWRQILLKIHDFTKFRGTNRGTKSIRKYQNLLNLIIGRKRSGVFEICLFQLFVITDGFYSRVSK